MIATRGLFALLLALLAVTAPRADGEPTAEQRRELDKKAHALHDEALQQYQRGALAKSADLLREELDVQYRLYPHDKYPDGHADIAQCYGNLALVLQELGRPDQAEQTYRQAIDMYRRVYPRDKHPEGDSDFANTLSNLGFLLRNQGEYARAEPFSREALAMRRLLFPPEKYPDGHGDLAVSLNNVGSLLDAQGQYAEAEALLRESLAMLRRLYPKEKFPRGHPALATGLNNLGLQLHRHGDYALAEPFYREALAMNRRLFPKEQFPNGHPYVAGSLNNLAGLLASRHEHAEAEAVYREALDMYRRLLPKERFPDGHPSLAGCLSNLGGVVQARGDYAGAEPFLREALDMTRRLYPPAKHPEGQPQLATALHNLGFLMEESGQYERAEALYREALEMNRRLYPEEKYPDGHPNLAGSLNNRGTLLERQGRYADAEPYVRSALRMYQRLALRYADAAAEAEALNYVATLPLSRDGLLSVTRRLPPDPAAYDRLWDARAALTRLLERRHRDLLASRDEEARDLGRQLVEARQRLAFLLLHPARDAEEHRKEVEKRTEAKEGLERRLARRLQLAPPRTDPGQVTPARLAELLPADAAFIDLLHYTDTEYDPRTPGKKGEKRTPRYVAFVVRKGQPVARVELNEAAPIDAARDALREAITAPRPDEAAERRAAAALARLVWQPLRDALPADLKTVYLAAEGRLSQVPWGALPGRKPDTVLLDDCSVCLVPHGHFLLECLEDRGAAARSGDTLLAYGGIDYAQGSEAAVRGGVARAPLLADKKRVLWPPLPGTAREQRQVVALAEKVLRDRPVVRSGRAAGTAQLLDDLPKARYAHLATHGFFADPRFRSALQVDPALFDYGGAGERRAGARSPLVLSGLVLAGANRDGPDAAPDRGIVTGEALVGLPLEGLELAVLSACETGLGEDGGGEGAYGLQRAFHVAGCRNVVASLWKVDDGATQALMALFYRNLWEKKLDAAEALRQAQLTLYRHPEAVEAAQKRGADFAESDLPKVQEKPRRSPAAHWAAFTFSGVRPAK